MPLEFRRNEVNLLEACGAEDALELADWFAKRKRPKVNLAACTHLHAAVLQTLAVFKPVLATPPADPFLARWVVPMLETASPPKP